MKLAKAILIGTHLKGIDIMATPVGTEYIVDLDAQGTCALIKGGQNMGELPTIKALDASDGEFKWLPRELFEIQP